MSPVVLIGCGTMAQSYAAVLHALDVPFIVIGRGRDAAARFAAATGIEPQIGGVDAVLSGIKAPKQEIVAVDVPNLDGVTQTLLQHGVRNLLVEKPACLTPERARAVATAAREIGTQVFVAYNRRWFASMRAARRMIDDDGGITSCRFDFTERAQQIGALALDPLVKRQWFSANSTHVLDLAFFLAGPPTSLTAHRSGHLVWHPSGAVFVGAGTTKIGAPFSYHANWTAPGRWSVEIATRRHRLFLQPLEELHVQAHGQFDLAPVPLEDDLDQRFKPGLCRQTRAFLEGHEAEALLPIAEHAERMAIYGHVLAGTSFTAGQTSAVAVA